MEIRNSADGSFKFACDPGYHATWFTFEDEQVVRDQFWHPPEGSVVLDVGCGFGSYMLPAFAAGAVRAYGWTPLPFEIEVLEKSLDANGWRKAAYLYQMALSKEDGHICPDTGEFRSEPFQGSFQATTLDKFLDKMDLSGECWMKVDVEGAEVDVLEGGAELIRRVRPAILVEGHEFRHAGITGEVIKLLDGWGYRVDGSAPHHGVTHTMFRPG